MDTTLLNTTIPPEVSAAIGRIRMGSHSDADTQALMAFMRENSDTLRPDQVRALTAIVDLAAAPRGPGGFPTSIQIAPEQAPANLPTPSPSLISGPPNVADVRASSGLPTNIQGSGTHYPGISNTFTERVDTALPSSQMGDSLPSLTPSPISPMPPGGYGASGAVRRGARQQERIEARGGTPGTPREDWRGIQSMAGDSAFAGIDPMYLQMFASDPNKAAQQISRQRGGGDMYASGIAPTMGSLMSLAGMGILGGSKGHGIGLVGPQKALGRAENVLNNQLSQGEYIDPAGVLRMTSHRLSNTGNELLGSDVNSQIDATNQALLAPQKNLVSEEQYNALARMLSDATNDYLMGLANGEIPMEMTYPRWLREQRHAQGFFGK